VNYLVEETFDPWFAAAKAQAGYPGKAHRIWRP